MNAESPASSGRLASAAWVLMAAPWKWRRSDVSRRAFRLNLGLWAGLLLAPLATALCWLPIRVAVPVVGVCLALLIALVWGFQFTALLRLDHPHSARLVPGHQGAVRRTALVLWCALVLLCGVLGLLLAGVAGLDAWIALPAALLVGAAMLSAVAASLRWWWLWFGWWLGPALLDLLGGRAWTQAMAGAYELWRAQPASLTVLLLLALGAALWLPFGRGDAAHQRAYASQRRINQATRLQAAGQQPTLAAYGRWGEVLGTPSQHLADAWMARVLARARPRPDSVMDRAELVLHGAQHWVRHLGAILPLLGILSLVLVLPPLLWGQIALEQFFERSRVALGIGLFSVLLAFANSLPGALWLSRREQALLVLLPGMPQRAQLNHALAKRQLRHHLMCCAFVLPPLVLLATLAQAPQLWALVVVALATGPWLWRDVSRQRAPHLAQFLWPYGGAMLLGLGSLAALRAYPAAWGPWLLVLVGLSGALATWRWRRLAALPQALPAGRLA